MTNIFLQSHGIDFTFEKEENLKNWLNTIISKYGHSLISLSYVFCSDDKLLEINKKHLNHNYYTDVITFDLSDSPTEIEGEVFISINRVYDNASSLRTHRDEELARVMVHGLLHLIGLKDGTNEEKLIMQREENVCLSLLLEVPRGTLKD